MASANSGPARSGTAARRDRSAREAHEAKCLRCGRCCADKYIVGDRVYFAEGVCRYLDHKTKLCTIYEHRHQTNTACLSVDEGIRLGVFPSNCPYVADLPNYVPPVETVVDKQTLRLVERGKILTPEELDEHLRRKRERPVRKTGRSKRRKRKR